MTATPVPILINCRSFVAGSCVDGHGEPGLLVCTRCRRRRPVDSHQTVASFVAQPVAFVEDVVSFDGSREWAEAKRLAIAGDVVGFDAWVVGVTDRLPYCCRGHWIEYHASHPLEGDRLAWLVAAHNAVNARLGRREWTVAEALADLPA